MARTQNVAGVELERSKIRAGTKCKCCGTPINGVEGVDYHKTRTKSCAVAYVCDRCIRHGSYGSDLQRRAIIGGKLTSGNYRFAVEVEANYRISVPSEIRRIDAYLAAQWGLQPSDDCTVDVEYHMTNRVNFHGLKDFYRDLEKLLDLNAPNCGHHINISKITWSADDMQTIRDYKRELFEPLAAEIESAPDAAQLLFGRFFAGFASNDNMYVHGSWINLENTYHIEFRLPHFRNATQFFYCTNYCRDVVDIIDDFLQDPDNRFEKASQKIVNLFRAYVEGRANCQRPERNRNK